MTTPLLGLGFAPLGMAPCGLGAPATSDPLSGATSYYGAVSSVNVDPVTRDYVLDTDGNETAMSDTAQRVWICLATLKGSRRNFGAFGLGVQSHITDAVVSETTEAVRSALAPCVADGSVELVSVQPEVDPSCPTRLLALIKWRDTKRNTTQTTPQPL